MESGSSMMSVAPASRRAGISTLISDLATTVSTAKPEPPNSSFTVGDFIDGMRLITASRWSPTTFIFTRTFPRASKVPCRSRWSCSIAWRLSGLAEAAGLATNSVKLVKMVSMTFRPAARRARPVSVMSTTTSTMSGTLASVAP